MRRTILLLAGVLLSVVALGSDSPKEYSDAVRQVDELEGAWEPFEANFEGGLNPIFHSLLTLGAGQWNYHWGSETFSGTYRIDATYKLAYLEETNPKGRAKGATCRYIYKRDGETLQLGSLPDRSVTPKNFDDKELQIITYKRVKK